MSTCTSPFPSTSAATLRAVMALCAIFTVASLCRLDPALWGQLPAADGVRQALVNEGLLLGQALVVTLAAGLLICGARAWLARWRAKPSTPVNATGMRTVIAMGVVVMAALVAPPSYALITGQPRGEGQILARGTPLYLGEEVARRGIAGKLAAPADWAGYLAWKSGGRLRPLAARDIEAILRGDSDWLELLAGQQAQYLAAGRHRHPQLVRLATLESRAEHPRLRIIYQDQRCILAELVQH